LQSTIASLSPCPIDRKTHSKSAVKIGSIPFRRPIVVAMVVTGVEEQILRRKVKHHASSHHPSSIHPSHT
jgi:hypothetical protein